MTQVKFEIRSERAGEGLKGWDEEVAPFLEVLNREFPGCEPALVYGIVGGRRPVPLGEQPILSPGAAIVKDPRVTSVTLTADSEITTPQALDVVNRALAEIGRPDLRVELREL